LENIEGILAEKFRLVALLVLMVTGVKRSSRHLGALILRFQAPISRKSASRARGLQGKDRYGGTK
jgi:hypothetical protein